MSLVRVKGKFQVTIPHSLRDQTGLSVGDYLEAKVERGVITLTPQTILDRRLAEGLEDLDGGRSFGPYSSAGEAEAAFGERTTTKPRKTDRRR